MVHSKLFCESYPPELHLKAGVLIWPFSYFTDKIKFGPIRRISRDKIFLKCNFYIDFTLYPHLCDQSESGFRKASLLKIFIVWHLFEKPAEWNILHSPPPNLSLLIAVLFLIRLLALQLSIFTPAPNFIRKTSMIKEIFLTFFTE